MRIQARDFWCPVVSEAVRIRLTRPSGLSRPSGYFVQCNQADCQYVEKNEPPCPLTLDLFAAEVEERNARQGGSPT